MVLLTEAPHPNAARVFFNWLLSKEGADARAQANGDRSFRKAGQDFRPQALRHDEGIVWMTLQGLELQDKWVREGTLNFIKQ